MTNFSLFFLLVYKEMSIFAVLKLKLNDYEYDYRSYQWYAWKVNEGSELTLLKRYTVETRALAAWILNTK